MDSIMILCGCITKNLKSLKNKNFAQILKSTKLPFCSLKKNDKIVQQTNKNTKP